MTDAERIEIEAIRERHAKATPGPWDMVEVDGRGEVLLGPDDEPGFEREDVLFGVNESANFDFIANARTDVPFLLDMLAERDTMLAGICGAANIDTVGVPVAMLEMGVCATLNGRALPDVGLRTGRNVTELESDLAERDAEIKALQSLLAAQSDILAESSTPAEQRISESEMALSLERQANALYRDRFGCLSCGEDHPAEAPCPPHEVRVTGQDWFRGRVGELSRENQRLRADAERFPEKLKEAVRRTRRQVVESMHRTAVNCGMHSNCAVAGWWLNSLEKEDAARKGGA